MTNNKPIQLLLVEPSLIVSEGLTKLIELQEQAFFICKVDTIEEIELQLIKKNFDIVIINPTLFNNSKALLNLKISHNDTKWIALVYAYVDAKILSKFDEIITISDKSDSISATINKLLSKNIEKEISPSQDVLSEREIDVLKELAQGSANKDIAEKLNISIHTVISHRKNITIKTGIKSVSGLTIYAVMQKIIEPEFLKL